MEKTQKAENLIKIRKQKKRTQLVLSHLSGVSIQAIRQYEQGTANIDNASYSILRELARALECSIEDIVNTPLERYYIIYRKGYKTDRPIQEIMLRDVSVHISKVIEHSESIGEFEFSKDEREEIAEYSHIYEGLEIYFNRQKLLKCGDYILVKTHNVLNIERPDHYEFSKDILTKI